MALVDDDADASMYLSLALVHGCNVNKLFICAALTLQNLTIGSAFKSKLNKYYAISFSENNHL